MKSPPEPTGHRDGAFGLAERDGKILLVKNARVSGGRLVSLWDLPGGTLEPGEALKTGLWREWAEETGLSAEVGELLLVVDGSKARTADGPPLYTWRAFVFAVSCGPGEPAAGEGIDAIEWVDRDEAAERLSAPYHAALRDYLTGDKRAYRRIDWIEPVDEADTIDAEIPRDLLVVAATAAAGDLPLLATELERALTRGVSHARLEEALLQIVPYAGYPRSIAAFGVARDILGAPDAASLGDVDQAEHAARGAATFEAVYGDTAEKVSAGLDRLHPVLKRWTLEHAYGRVLARDGVLSLVDRELLAVSILTALGNLDNPLLGHMRAAVRAGASKDAVAAAVSVVPSSLGPGKRAAARALLERLDA